MNKSVNSLSRIEPMEGFILMVADIVFMHHQMRLESCLFSNLRAFQ